jgi:hypothetical protein
MFISCRVETANSATRYICSTHNFIDFPISNIIKEKDTADRHYDSWQLNKYHFGCCTLGCRHAALTIRDKLTICGLLAEQTQLTMSQLTTAVTGL